MTRPFNVTRPSRISKTACEREQIAILEKPRVAAPVLNFFGTYLGKRAGVSADWISFLTNRSGNAIAGGSMPQVRSLSLSDYANRGLTKVSSEASHSLAENWRRS